MSNPNNQKKDKPSCLSVQGGRRDGQWQNAPTSLCADRNKPRTIHLHGQGVTVSFRRDVVQSGVSTTVKLEKAT